MIMRNLKLGSTVLTLAALAACGGGGGSAPANTVSSVPAPSQAALPKGSNIVNTIPVGTYTADSEELQAFNLLNAERSSCGFGTLAQNVSLDKAALAHSNWVIVNNVLSHYEVAGTPLFTGAKAIDRIIAAGYLTSDEGDNEILSKTTSRQKLGFGKRGARELLNAPYHMAAALSGYRDVGTSVRSESDLGTPNPFIVLQFSLGYKVAEGPQVFASDEVKTYPCEGSTGVLPNMSGEIPNPVPGRELFGNPLGSTVYVQVRNGNTLKVLNASMTNAATGALVVLREPLTAANDPHSAEGVRLSGHQALIMPDTQLTPLTKYQVTVTGTNDGISFSRSFGFTTGEKSLGF